MDSFWKGGWQWWPIPVWTNPGTGSLTHIQYIHICRAGPAVQPKIKPLFILHCFYVYVLYSYQKITFFRDRAAELQTAIYTSCVGADKHVKRLNAGASGTALRNPGWETHDFKELCHLISIKLLRSALSSCLYVDLASCNWIAPVAITKSEYESPASSKHVSAQCDHAVPSLGKAQMIRHSALIRGFTDHCGPDSSADRSSCIILFILSSSSLQMPGTGPLLCSSYNVFL